MTHPSHTSMQPFINYLPSQENVGCCTASAALLAAEIILSRQGVKVHLSRLYLYYMTRKMQNRIGQRGTDLSTTLLSLSQTGAPTEYTWPFIVSRTDTEPNMIAVLEAVNYTAHSYNSTTLLNFKHYLSNNIPIIIGMHTGKLFWNLRGPMSTQMYKPINDMDNRLAQGHALTLIGYDDNLNGGSWIAANSLGYHWGDHGLAAIPYACNDEIGEAYVITNFAGFDAGKENI